MVLWQIMKSYFLIGLGLLLFFSIERIMIYSIQSMNRNRNTIANEAVEGNSVDRENSLGNSLEDISRNPDNKIDLYLPEENVNGEPSPGSGGPVSDGSNESDPLSPPSSIPSKISWGAYTGWRVSDVETFRTTVGVDMQYLASFVHWGNENEFPLELAQYANTHGMTLVIYWEAMDYNFPTARDSRFSYDAIIRGDWDPYILSFANSVAAYGNSVVLVLFEEMNSDWYPWSGTINGNSSTKHVLAYRHVRDMFRYTENAKFAWTVNNDSVPDTPANARLAYYPGDNYVDYVGVDGFNFGNPWQSFSQVFDGALADVSSLGKPVIIFSMACQDGSQKAKWIQDALSVQIPSRQSIIGWIWFNENKERDWRVWSDAASLKAFQESLSLYRVE